MQGGLGLAKFDYLERKKGILFTINKINNHDNI